MTAVLLDIPAADYHADSQLDRPALSSSIANLLLNRSPAHAKAAHPKLNPDWAKREEARFDVGSASHALLLEGRDAVQPIAALDWRTADAKAMRDEARAAGKIPLLLEQYYSVQELCAAVREQLAALPITPSLLAEGRPEQTLVWEERGVLCKARLDWLRDDRAAVDDLKTTSASANPYVWAKRTLWGIGADVQCAFYLRGCRAVLDADPEFRWVVCETEPPYAVSVVSLAPDALALADAKVDHALNLWARCLETDEWPGYPQQVCYAEAPGWMEADWLEKEAREAA